jgi:hypothetical protein
MVSEVQIFIGDILSKTATREDEESMSEASVDTLNEFGRNSDNGFVTFHENPYYESNGGTGPSYFRAVSGFNVINI